MVGKLNETELARKRRDAERKLERVAGDVAGRLGLPWSPPKRQWDLEAWRCDLLERVTALLETAAGDGGQDTKG